MNRFLLILSLCIGSLTSHAQVIILVSPEGAVVGIDPGDGGKIQLENKYSPSDKRTGRIKQIGTLTLSYEEKWSSTDIRYGRLIKIGDTKLTYDDAKGRLKKVGTAELLYAGSGGRETIREIKNTGTAPVGVRVAIAVNGKGLSQ